MRPAFLAQCSSENRLAPWRGHPRQTTSTGLNPAGFVTIWGADNCPFTTALHMPGIQISGLVANSAFDWKSVVDQLIAADGTPITTLQQQQTTNTNKVNALGALQTSLVDLQSSLQSLRSGNVFTGRTVSSDTANTTWTSSSSNGAPIGTYTFAVQDLATTAKIAGAANASQGLSATNDVSGLTIANLNTASPVTAGVFTINGQQFSVATTDSLQSVFNNIATATGGDITATYDSASDKILLSSATGPVVLGAANDTSNFLQAMRLNNNGTGSVTSSSPLGTLKLAATIATSGLATPLTGLDASGNGAFKINGVTINYNASTGSLAALISTINQSGAGVTAAYDSANDRVSLVNNATGDIGIGLSDVSGNLLAALGLTPAAGSTFTRGSNAQFTVNGGPVLTSMSNTLDGAVTGITGLSVTVNTKTTQSVQVGSDTAAMQSALQDFITKFNAVQSYISTNTKITSSGTKVTTSVLSDNHEVQDWAAKLQSLAFDAVTGQTGTVQRLDNIGIGFTGTTGQLSIINSDQLASALANHPDDVQKFLLTGSTGFVSKMFGYLTKIVTDDTAQKSVLTKANSDIDTQVATLQTRLDAERAQLTTAFLAMQDAQSKANSQNQYLTATFFKSTTTSCWVARVVYGVDNLRWLVFRFWLLQRAPEWFRQLYLRHGERFARWLEGKPRVQAAIRRWMDARIASLDLI
jgi:flagellar hook-associated protein 2